MSGDPLGLYDYRPGDSSNVLLQKILRACAALPGSMGIPEAPIDGQPYARQNASWVVAAGGTSVIAGVVDAHADLPVTVGSPAVNAAYLVRESSGAWLPFYDSRKAGGIWVRQFNNGNLDDWVYSGELQATQNASNFTVYDPTDPTKEIGFSAAGITAGVRRLLSPLDKSYTLEETGHATKHVTGGSDVIADAVAAGTSGLMSGADKTKLNGIEAGADVTDAVNVAAAGAVMSGGALGTPSSGNLSACTADGTNKIGFRELPSNSQSANYTTVLADSGKAIDHPASDANARTYTIDSNANVAYPVGTCITFTNMAAQALTIGITDDALYLAGAGTTGNRTLAQYGLATARKMTSTTWLIGGTGLT